MLERTQRVEFHTVKDIITLLDDLPLSPNKYVNMDSLVLNCGNVPMGITTFTIPKIDITTGAQREKTGDFFLAYNTPGGSMNLIAADNVTSETYPDTTGLGKIADVNSTVFAPGGVFSLPKDPLEYIKLLDKVLYRGAMDQARATWAAAKITQEEVVIYRGKNTDVGCRIGFYYPNGGVRVAPEVGYSKTKAQRIYEDKIIDLSHNAAKEFQPDGPLHQALNSLITGLHQIKFDGPDGYRALGHGNATEGVETDIITLDPTTLKDGVDVTLYTDGFAELARLYGFDPFGLLSAFWCRPRKIPSLIADALEKLRKEIPPWMQVRGTLDDICFINANSKIKPIEV